MCVETACELFIRSSHCLPHSPCGSVFAFPHMTPQLFTIISPFLYFLCSLFLLSVGTVPYCLLHYALLPSTLNSFLSHPVLRAAWEKFWPQTLALVKPSAV